MGACVCVCARAHTHARKGGGRPAPRAASAGRAVWCRRTVPPLPVRSVGVMGDERTYDLTIAVRAVESQGGMRADWVKLPYELLEKLSNRIINEVKGVNRCVFDITSKPPGTIEWE